MPSAGWAEIIWKKNVRTVLALRRSSEFCWGLCEGMSYSITDSDLEFSQGIKWEY
jgi:hypothetical protein